MSERRLKEALIAFVNSLKAENPVPYGAPAKPRSSLAEALLPKRQSSPSNHLLTASGVESLHISFMDAPKGAKFIYSALKLALKKKHKLMDEGIFSAWSQNSIEEQSNIAIPATSSFLTQLQSRTVLLQEDNNPPIGFSPGLKIFGINIKETLSQLTSEDLRNAMDQIIKEQKRRK